MKDSELLSLVAERDYCDWRLRRIHDMLRDKSPLSMAIDQATGRDWEEERAEAEQLIARVKEISSLLEVPQ